MLDSPKGSRLHIGFFGRRNVGKSSLLNALVGQQVSIVSPQPGTTTDPVEKAMELPRLGPVLFLDTPGVDDEGGLGAQRVSKTRLARERVDLAVVVAGAGEWGEAEEALLADFEARKVPVVVAFNKIDLASPSPERLAALRARGVAVVAVDALAGTGVTELREAVIAAAPVALLEERSIAGDLVGPGELAVLVVPLDSAAPRGRLILPQVQTIRDLLDADAMSLVVTPRQLRAALAGLARPPRLVITDSQAFREVAESTPPEVPLTSFSILFSRLKGDLGSQVEGAMAIDSLQPGDRVLIAEACAHHPGAEDIGRVKLPRLLTRRAGGELEFAHVQGQDFPDDLAPYRLVVHCGGCTFNRRKLLERLARCRRAGVPMTNYGLSIAYSLGIFERALGPFPEVHARFLALRK